MDLNVEVNFTGHKCFSLVKPDYSEHIYCKQSKSQTLNSNKLDEASSCYTLFIFLIFLFLLSLPLSSHPCSEEDGEQGDKTIWYYSTKVNPYFLLSQVFMFTWFNVTALLFNF